MATVTRLLSKNFDLLWGTVVLVISTMIMTIIVLFFRTPIPSDPSSLYTARQFIHQTNIQSSPLYPLTEIPTVWRRLGCNTQSDVAELIPKVNRRRVFELLVDEYMSPWSSATYGIEGVAPISTKLIDSMEVPLRANAARIRLPGDGRVLYRVVEHWPKTYRLHRFLFFIDMVARILKRYPEMRLVRCEFYVNVGDGPISTVDSTSQEFGALPLLAFRTALHHIDIPVPDPVEHGSKVTGEGYVLDESKLIPWHEKMKKMVFRGVASCVQKQHFGNWFLNPRVRVSTISSMFPEHLDAGITKWIKLSHGTTAEDVERSANISIRSSLTLEEQMKYRYILDVDGGLGSSRKRWMLTSGSTPFFQTSSIHQWYEPLLVKWVHYVPVDRWFRNLIEHIIWAKQHDDRAKAIAYNGRFFARKFLSQDAILEYFVVLLQRYSELQKDARPSNESVPNPCVEEPDIDHGPMACSTGWFRHYLGDPLPFGCRYKSGIEENFVCHRPYPESGRKQVKQGIFEPYLYVEGVEKPLFRHTNARFREN